VLYELLSKSYYIEEKALYPVDTFQLLARAHESSDPGRRHSESKLVFQSINRYSFSIDKDFYHAIINKQDLKDTLMYHGIQFIPFTTKEYADNYKESKSPTYIKVFQLQIGDTKYIDVDYANKLAKAKLKRDIVIPPVFILFFGVLLIEKINWTTIKIIAWAIAFSATVITLLILL
jgi:hypothetical protein